MVGYKSAVFSFVNNEYGGNKWSEIMLGLPNAICFEEGANGAIRV